MRIITISREFGSGGRELGKRLADALGVPCYDQQIIDMIAQKKNLGKNYIAHVSEKDGRVLYPSTIGKHIIAPNYIGHQSVQILVEQKKLIEELAAQGDCVIVGRCADLILKEHHPLNIFVYADQESKAARCLERSDKSEKLSPDQLVRKMKESTETELLTERCLPAAIGAARRIITFVSTPAEKKSKHSFPD